MRATAQPGDFFVLIREGHWADSWPRFVQWFVCWGSRSRRAYHAGLLIGDNLTIQAEPGGARLMPVPRGSNVVWKHIDATDEQRAGISATGKSLKDTPYSMADDICLGLARRFGWHLPARILWRVIGTSHLECAALVDYALDKNGVHLFNDGRVPGAVTPGDLDDLDLAEVPGPK